jgi:type VI secretion system protein ImpE
VTIEAAERTLREGNIAEAIARLQEQVRKAPADAELRVFLFQLLSVTGDWDRALNQLDVAADLDAKTLAMAQMYREALRCETLRADVFAGRKAPLVFGQPDQWLALLIEALLTEGRDGGASGETLRATAFEQAPASAGAIDGKPFAWIADADMRLGPICEAIINGRYYWVPFDRLARIAIEAPTDLRDVVWMPAHFEFANGGEAVGIIPTRYPGTEHAEDDALRLSRKTIWREAAPGVFRGLGQRMLTTDDAEVPLMDAREIRIGAPAGNAADAADAQRG